MPPVWLYPLLFGLFSLLVGLIALRGRRAMREVGRMLRNLEAGRPVRRLLGLYPGQPGRLVEIYNEVGPELEARLERLNSDRNLLFIVLEGMAEGVLAVDGRKRVLFVNRAALELFALGSPGIGRLLAEVIRSPTLQSVVDATFSSESPHRQELQLPVAQAHPGSRRATNRLGPWPATRRRSRGCPSSSTTSPRPADSNACDRISSPTPRTS